MTNTKKLRKFFGYTQEQLAKLLGVSRSTVAMWETSSQEPEYEIVSKMALIFNVSSDFVMGTGIFKNWEQVIEYYDDISFELQKMIPPGLEMPSFSEDKNLVAWLDTRLYFEPDEIQLARWFAFAVKDIQITPTGIAPDGSKSAKVKIVFTQEFNALIDSEKRKKEMPIPVSRDGQVEKLANALTEIGIDVEGLTEAQIRRIARLSKAALEE